MLLFRSTGSFFYFSEIAIKIYSYFLF